MKVVALISGGKDSCYNMIQCVVAGHEIVALANLKPESKDELDSFMYQTVGHQGVELYAEAMNIPLFRHLTTGVALQSEKSYTPTPEDEVEDLYQLLVNVKEKIDIEAVAVGAVLSDYQRLRVENVCSRLGLVALAYLWRRDQAELLQEMIDFNIDAIIIKVAALGLDPTKHLGMRISEIQPHLVKMYEWKTEDLPSCGVVFLDFVPIPLQNEKYGLNICGEGGEYETFTLNCPLFSKSLVIDDYETVIHSNDAIAPVGYLNFRQIRLVDKEGIDPNSSLSERLREHTFKTADDYIADIDQADLTDTEAESGDGDVISVEHVEDTVPLLEIKEGEPAPMKPSVVMNLAGWCWVGGVVGDDPDQAVATSIAVKKLQNLLGEKELGVGHLVWVCLYVRDLGAYAEVNRAYVETLGGPEPPVRVCLGTGLNERTPVMLSALAYAHNKHTMHVQALSHWAPANIGPYSQAIRVGDLIYVAGQIGLVPGSMLMVRGGIRRQCRLALRHVDRLIKAMDKDTQLRHVVQAVCFITNGSFISEARKEWERRSNNAIVDYVVVPQLPRSALVEWQVWAHRGNSRFEYEETGCVVGENRVSIRRRWNYDNTVSAIVCYVSTVSSVSNPVISELGSVGVSCETLSESQLVEVLRYALGRLFRGLPVMQSEPPTKDEEENENTEGGLASLSPLPVASLQVYYRVGRSPPPAVIHQALASLDQFNMAATLLPVCQLNHPNTFLSMCALRHL